MNDSRLANLISTTAILITLLVGIFTMGSKLGTIEQRMDDADAARMEMAQQMQRIEQRLDRIPQK